MVRQDGGAEDRVRDVCGSGPMEDESRTLADFLSTVGFADGSRAMKGLSIVERIRWVSLLALLWEMTGRAFQRVSLAPCAQSAVGWLGHALREIDPPGCTPC